MGGSPEGYGGHLCDPAGVLLSGLSDRYLTSPCNLNNASTSKPVVVAGLSVVGCQDAKMPVMRILAVESSYTVL
jgi:hypothetical protein